MVIKEVVVEGLAYYVPMTGIAERFKDGKSVNYMEFKIPEGSLHVGRYFWSDDFRLKPGAWEPLFDVERQKFLYDDTWDAFGVTFIHAKQNP